jgi:hypothetical protein
MKRLVAMIVAGPLILAGGSALAKEAKEAKETKEPKAAPAFFVAQDAATKKCKIVRTEPDGASLIMVGTSTYPSRDEAQAAAKDAEECKQAKKAEASDAD